MMRIKSLPEISRARTVNSGFLSCITHVILSSSRMRVSIAKPSPRNRARGLSATGSLSTRMEMKTMLSMPSTISITVSVSRAIQASGLLIQEKSR